MDERRSDDPGRRSDDKRWAHVQAQLATTRQAVTSLEASVEDLRDEFKALDSSLYGGVKAQDSISVRLRGVEHRTEELYRVVIGDNAGMGGIKRMVEGLDHRLETLEGGIKSLAESRKDRIVRWSAVFVAAISTLGLIMTNLDKVAVGSKTFVEVFGKQEPLSAERIERDIERLKKERGPEVRRKLRQLEREARGLR